MEKSPFVDSTRVNPGDFDLPMHLTPYLSGNFGELRNNHLHSGLDFKTLKSVGYPIYAVADGWVSRIRVSNYGFGYALYINHPNGFTTVYGHLQKYASPIDQFTKNAQYRIEQFELDTLLKRGAIPVKRGQIVAYSGNAGVSAAPHLHFEIRDTKTEETIDPLLWYSNRIKDSIPPRFEKIALYALEGEGALSTGTEKSTVSTIRTIHGDWGLNGKLPTAWGKVGLGLNAYDHMNGTSNLYGVRSVSLFLENEKIFQQEMSHFSFDQTRYVNSLADYETWIRNRSWIMKSFIEPQNKLNIYLNTKNNGYINIHEEKIYHLRYEIEDRVGNISKINFEIQGKRKDIPVLAKGPNYFNTNHLNHFTTSDIRLSFPIGSIYTDVDLQFQQKPSEKYSDLYMVHHLWTPLHEDIPISVRIQKDVLESKKAYYLAKQDRYGSFQYAGGTYVNGWIQSKIHEFGNYMVMADTVPPKIIGIGLENAVKNRLFRIRISDNASGIKSWRGTIDGKWILFEFDGKTSQLKYQFDDSRLIKGGTHKLVLSVKDACGNESHLERTFNY